VKRISFLIFASTSTFFTTSHGQTPCQFLISVPTEEFIKQQLDLRKTFVPNRLSEVDWEEQASWMQELFACMPHDRPTLLANRPLSDLVKIIKFCESIHEQDLLFDSFHTMLRRDPLPQSEVVEMLKIHSPLVFSILKTHPPSEEGMLPPVVEGLLWPILQTLMRCGNGFPMAVLVALEKMGGAVRGLRLDLYCQLLELAALCIRATNVVQEVLLVLNDTRLADPDSSPLAKYAQKYALGVAFERAEEAADECPCDETGKPAKQRSTPPRVKLHRFKEKDDSKQKGKDKQKDVETQKDTNKQKDTDKKKDKDKESDNIVKADIRIDYPSSVRLHSLVRLQAASKAEKGWVAPWAMDGIVVGAIKGELKIELLHPAPSEMEEMDWLLFNAGSIGERFQLDFEFGTFFS
jgi:hypothetical protein